MDYRFDSARPEIQILLSCSRSSLDSRETERIRRLVENDVDWNYLQQSAFRHGVKPLLALHLNSICPDKIPDEVREELLAFFRSNAGHNIFLANELVKLLDLIEKQGIPVIPYKGPAMTMSLYGNLSCRQFGDLDLLVRREDALRLKGFFLQQGFRQAFQFTPAQERSYLRYQSSYELQRGNVLLEIHWAFVPVCFLFRVDFDSLYKRAVSLSVQGVSVRTLSHEDLLLVLCVDSGKDLWERVLRICDVAELLRAYPQMNWSEILQRANAVGVLRLLFVGLSLAHDLLGADIPPSVLKLVQNDAMAQHVAFKLHQRLFADPSEKPLVLGKGQFQPLYMSMRERFPDKVAYFFRLIITPNVGEWTMMRLPDSLAFLYYLIRPARLAGKYGLRIMRRLYAAKRGPQTLKGSVAAHKQVV